MSYARGMGVDLGTGADELGLALVPYGEQASTTVSTQIGQALQQAGSNVASIPNNIAAGASSVGMWALVAIGGLFLVAMVKR